MSKKKVATSTVPVGIFGEAKSRRRKVLILPRYLEEEAEAQSHRDHGPEFDKAHALLIKWADLEAKGRLEKKETSLDAEFLHEVFGEALGYALPNFLLE